MKKRKCLSPIISHSFLEVYIVIAKVGDDDESGSCADEKECGNCKRSKNV
jgi:hypothetical protein